MILSKPLHHSPSRTHLNSYSELAPCFSTPELLASPPNTPPRGHKHSLSKPMTWLNRSSSSTSGHSVPHTASKPTRISEPKFGSSLEQLNFHRVGPLGSGATVVRTPQEALFGPTHGTPDLTSEVDGVKQDVLVHETAKNESRLPPVFLPSPPLPPLPDVPGPEEGRSSGAPANLLLEHGPPPRSSSLPSPSAHFSASLPTSLENSRTPSRPTATLPADTPLVPPQPPFEAVLLSPIPEGAINPSKLIVLETCTTTFRTSLRSLASRPSHLSRYITSLLSSVSEAMTASVCPNASDTSSGQNFCNGSSSFFRDLALSGYLSQSTGIHIFLDRPSAPYTHVLAYLRSATSTPEHLESLPRAVQLGSAPPSESRLESLLELRDEASYLGLVELEELCCHEIYQFQCAPLLTSPGGTPRGKTGSVHSFRTIVEQCQSRHEPSPSDLPVSKSNGISGGRRITKSTREPNSGSSSEARIVPIRERGRQAKEVKYGVGSPPPGWI